MVARPAGPPAVGRALTERTRAARHPVRTKSVCPSVSVLPLMTYVNASEPVSGAWNVIVTVVPSAVHEPFLIVVSDTLVVMSNVITVSDALPSALNAQIVC